MFDDQNRQEKGFSELAQFEKGLCECPDLRASLKAGLVGGNAQITGRFGKRKLVYADYVASGRALRQVEEFVFENVLPFYANSHTEDSYCGGVMTRMREEARQVILEKCGGAARDHAVVFAGSGATMALNKLVHLLGLREALARGEEVFVLVGPYEHHSNLLPWRESGAQVIEIEEAEAGGPDPVHLQSVLDEVAERGPVVAAFSAASNITGIGSDVADLTRIVKATGGKVVWDFAGGGPYLPVDMSLEGVEIDAVALSPHKFLGGPGASGVLIVRRDAVVAERPSVPGGGTVAFVNDHMQDYLARIEEREEGGTPNIVGDIRAALVMIVKDALGQDFITRRNSELTERAIAAWEDVPSIHLLGGLRRDRLPIFSFVVDPVPGKGFDYHLFTRALSDLYGIQARGGCACAGPYVHRLLQIDAEQSEALRAEILAGDESHKPGFVRLNLSVLMSAEEVAFVLSSVSDLANRFDEVAKAYA
ncbi:aminotransferase class V-fold PLP-dependent enzyme [Alisedimentitalea sp. MJ-SS2]|uniref:aminotransferase class V-fold PLP-dependent enzyme n=1 Tax=Aliisedimentitalea sp. MJ-SS2 TaxID=3049795 RepID=UPI002909EACA|nr:aminotransferase class V-fold PLP-dependent enzyme [Alisedimentitalea sp. MJ-SS2]MDU8926582.1 aminotransferase class V-fold PLP-dependent enzyme [Alisedimentitalea sp. MJ-SS2]